MSSLVTSNLLRSLETARALYHQLILLVGKSGSGKTNILREFARKLDLKVLNINLLLSAQLLELTVKQRALKLPGLLDQITSQAQSPLLLDNLEILFDKDLQQDPLKLLQNISRNRTVVASWNGTIDARKIEYAEPGHPEYRSYSAVDLLVINSDGTTSIDLENNFRGIEQV